MKAINLINHLESLGVKLSNIDGDLKINAPKGVLNQETVALIKENKSEILSYLALSDNQFFSLPIPTTLITGTLPLSAAQKRIWLATQIDNTSSNYHIPFVCKISGEFNLQKFSEAWYQLIETYSALRTNFITNNNEPYQSIQTGDALDFKIDIKQEQNEENIDKEVNTYVNQSFNLETDSLVRVRVWQKTPTEFVVAVVFHHIIVDGWSIEILLKELFQIYLSTQNFTQEVISIQDYIAWEQHIEHTQSWYKAKDYWLEKMSTDVTELDLSQSQQKTTKKESEKYSLVFDKSITQKIKAFTQNENVTLFNFLLTALKTLFYKYSDQNDIIVGCPTSGRNHWQLENQVGLFINTLPIRTVFADDISFRELLNQVKQGLLNDYDNQLFGYDSLVEALTEQKNENVTLFNVLFTLQNDDILEKIVSLTQNQPFKIAKYDFKYTPYKFELLFEVQESSNEILIDLCYDKNLYGFSQIQRLLSHYEILINQVVEEPNVKISALNYLSITETAELLVLNNTDESFQDEATLVSLFTEQAKKTPHAIALVEGELSWTYQELNEWTNQICSYLIENCKVAKGDKVGMHVERSGWMVASLYGIMKCGAAYVPIDTTYPVDRKKYIIDDSALAVILTSEDDSSVKSLVKFIVKQGDEKQKESKLSVKVIGEDSAYVIYTSGSTGIPKGVELGHTGIVNRIEWMKNAYDFNPQDVVLQKTPYVFDVSVWEFFMTLSYGAKLVLCTRDDVYNPESLANLIDKNKVTTLHFVPGMYQVFLESISSETEKKLVSIRQVFASGEALSVQTVKRHHTQLSWAKLHNLYGPTEASVDVSFYETTGQESIIPIGKPIQNTSLWVLDKNMQLKPKGIKGDIWIGGVGLAKGYVNKAALTAQSFVETACYGRIYRSGDIGKWSESNEIEYLGRKDNQVKVRGFRIELGEVEKAIIGTFGVEQAIVVIRIVNDEKELVAFYVSENNISYENWCEALSKKLPVYMIPAHFFVVKQMPLNTNGKIDRKALLKAIENKESEKSEAEWKTKTETQIGEIFSAVLKRSNLHANSNFFQSGGTSIKATRVISNINKTFGTSYSLGLIFQYPVIAHLASFIDTDRNSIQNKIQKAPTHAYYPLTDSQRRLWLFEQLNTQNGVFNMPFATRLEGNLDVKKLKSAIEQLIARHEVLRTRFFSNQGEAVQQVEEVFEIDSFFHLLDITNASNPKMQVDTIIKQELNHVFDLERLPNIYFKLIKVTAFEFVLFINLHHIIGDAWSMQLIFEEIITFYNSDSDKLSELEIQNKDIAYWQEQEWNSDSFTQQKHYWKEKLSDIQVVEMPTSFRRPAMKTYAGNRIAFALDNSQIKQIQSIANENGLSMFMLFTTIVNVVLHKYTNQEDIIVGTTILNRDNPQLANQVGFYINQLPIRTQFSRKDTVQQLAFKVKESILEGFQHKDLSFDRLSELTNQVYDENKSSIFDIWVEYNESEGSGVSSKSFENLTIQPIELHNTITKNDLSFRLIENNTELTFLLEYNTDIFEKIFAAQIYNHVIETFGRLKDIFRQSLEEISLLLEQEQQKLIVTFNETSVDFNAPIILKDAFEYCVEKYPTAKAVKVGEQTLSYQELNEAANKLAHHIKETFDIQAGSRIGLLMEHADYTIISLVAIIKTGALFVPIDPKYPSERKSFIVKDANIELLLTDSEHLFNIDFSVENIFAVDIQLANVSPKIQNLNTEIISTDLVYMIYTSGSTGTPKGVQITNQNFTNYLHWSNLYYFNNDQENPFAFFTSLSFDLTLTSIFTTLLRGDYVDVYGANDLSKTLIEVFSVESNVNTVKMTPSHVSYLSRLPIYQTNVSTVILGGENVTPPQVEFLLGLNPAINIYNEYGPTETTVGCTIQKLISTDNLTNIGRPIANTEIFILNDAMELVPQNVWGEICVGGLGVAAGYHNREELNKQKFLSNKFGKRLYRTGDLGRRLNDGTIELVGRIDNQVKIRGYRIELDEIEKVLLSSKRIKEVCVDVRMDANNEKTMCAYFVSDAEQELTTIKEFLKQQLPWFMIPEYFVQLDAFPLTANGKVNRKLLPNHLQNALNVQNESLKPQTDTEKIVYEIWQKILLKDNFSIIDNFLDIGGNSLKLVSMYAELSKVYTNRAIMVADLFKYTTIKALSEFLVPQETIVSLDFLEV